MVHYKIPFLKYCQKAKFFSDILRLASFPTEANERQHKITDYETYETNLKQVLFPHKNKCPIDTVQKT